MKEDLFPPHHKEDSIRLRILVVDDEEVIRSLFTKILKKKGYEVITAQCGKEAEKIVKKRPLDIALLDYNLPDETGIELMEHLRRCRPELLFLIITGFGTIERAVEAMQRGAWDFIEKPITSDMLLQKLDRLKEICQLRREQNFQHKVSHGNFLFPGVVGPSSAMKPVYEAILRAADNELPVLIEGETGSGKEYVAEAIHLNSKRMKQPYIILDCNATPESLFESILFGSTKGAFTGAMERKGLLREAHQGDLFLDEVGEISMEIQPKLLRCLETKRFRPVGGSKEVESDFRILCATNRDLKNETMRGYFRTDLFYRISAQRIRVPPLRERPSDIPGLIQHFLKEIAAQHKNQEKVLTPNALHRLMSYSWPGNIRQMKFTIESAYFNTPGDEIDEGDILLDQEPQPVVADQGLPVNLDVEKDFKTFREDAILSCERIYACCLMQRTKGDMRTAAQEAGLTRESLYRVLSRCGVSPADYREE